MGAATVIDAESRRWVQGLRRDSARHDETVARLRELLLRVARHELGRRRQQLGSITGPELDDLAQQAANDALLGVLARVGDFRGASRFTTWAYKFAIFAVSATVARHAWRAHPPSPAEVAWERMPDAPSQRPGAQVERQEQLSALSAAVADDLTDRQREVFVAVALNDVSIDVIALRLGSNRNAIYKNLFDARRRLRASLAAAGHPLTPEEAVA